jgi:hypothetical protein
VRRDAMSRNARGMTWAVAILAALAATAWVATMAVENF